MKILIAQPKLEKEIKQLEQEVLHHPSVDIIIYPEGYINHNVDFACELAKLANKMIVSGAPLLLKRKGNESDTSFVMS